MNGDSSKKVTVLAIASMFGLGMAKSLLVDKRMPPFRFFAANGFAAFLLSAAADVEPDIAGPFSLLVLTVVALEEGPPVLKALNGGNPGPRIQPIPQTTVFDSSVAPVTTVPPGWNDIFDNAQPLTMTPPKVSPKLPADPYAARRIFANPSRGRRQ